MRFYIKAILFLVSLIIFVLLFSFTIGKRDVIKDNEAGILVSRGKIIRIYRGGEKPFVVPFFQKFYLISIEPVTFYITGEEAMKVITSGKKDFMMESQITYKMEDVEKAVSYFGFLDLNSGIQERIKNTISKLLQDTPVEDASIFNTKQRISFMAQLHIDLNSVMKKEGININSFQIRFKTEDKSFI